MAGAFISCVIHWASKKKDRSDNTTSQNRKIKGRQGIRWVGREKEEGIEGQRKGGREEKRKEEEKNENLLFPLENHWKVNSGRASCRESTEHTASGLLTVEGFFSCNH